MKRPSIGSLKKVTAANLAGLGAERLAGILVDVAASRPDLKRRLRMELAAEHGAEHLVGEIDKRLGALMTSRGKIGWRQKPAFARDLDAVRQLIAERLAGLDWTAALERLWAFMATFGAVTRRLRDREGAVAEVYRRAAADLGALLAGQDARVAAGALVEAVAGAPQAWAEWAPAVLAGAPEGMAEAALTLAQARWEPGPGWVTAIRHIADAAGDVDAYRATWTAASLAQPAAAVEVARRYLAAGRIEEAGEALRAAAPAEGGRRVPDFDWESAWIDYLERSGEVEAAQGARWASFERTLSLERARAFTSRLTGFDDVEAEGRAFAYAAGHADFQAGLAFLMGWPALAEAGQMILARAEDIAVGAAEAELWAGQLRRRHPAAALLLLRRAAAAAFRRREFKACDRLTEEADAIVL